MKSKRRSWVVVFLSVAAGSSMAVAREPVVGGPCEGCEHVFVAQPDSLRSRSRIAPATTPGEPMIIEGTVRHADGTTASGIIVYAYQTNAEGIYPHGDTAHGALRGWARSDIEGHYRFDTIRPGGYPGRDTPEHVHMNVIEPGRSTYYIDDLVFADDPRLTPALRRQARTGRGGSGLGDPVRDTEGNWRVRRDIILGEGIPDHAAGND